MIVYGVKWTDVPTVETAYINLADAQLSAIHYMLDLIDEKCWSSAKTESFITGLAEDIKSLIIKNYIPGIVDITEIHLY